MTNYDLWVDFECRTIEDVKTIPGFGDIMASSYSVRDPDTMSISMGTMDFWISTADFYEVNDEINASWGIFDADGGYACPQQDESTAGSRAVPGGPAGGYSLAGWRIPAAGGLFLQNIHPIRERFPMLS